LSRCKARKRRRRDSILASPEINRITDYYGESLKKGGRVKKKKQGYKDRKDESIAMRIKKKRTKKQLKASRDDSYGRFGSKAKKSGKINK